ncbi:phospholipid-binding protein [Leptolyngbya ohadii]|uniref:phospholipid-binding protein n=1 Tax=Leptolyngbya ohadii TaxID=1962290 RepID=UPI00117A3CC4|nr:phospholipid-binding protein [Leptolyngbya ohadii]
MGQSTSSLLFATIPPERVGINGEYDHHGLAKRVQAALRQRFETDEIHGLRITQRGAVVVVVGEIVSQRFLIRLVRLVMEINGTADVEVNGVSMGTTLQYYLEVKPSKSLLGKLTRVLESPHAMRNSSP